MAPTIEAADGTMRDTDTGSMVIKSLKYAYPNGKQILTDFSLELPPGSRCLLSGANGAGKTTLLQVLAGKTMVGEDVVRVIGKPPFHDINLTCSGDLGYLGSQWRRNVGSAGSVALAGDFSAGKMIFGVDGVDPERRARLVELLDIDLDWSMMTVSDGQRRRVQICMGLLKPFKVLLCDEITVDLDILGRLDLLAFLQQECEERGATVVYATHIFDGMEAWMTHIAFASNGELKYGGPKDTIAGLDGCRHLLSTIEGWLRTDRDERRAREAAEALLPPKPKVGMAARFESRHMAYYR
eukprot:CAMPEP_0197591266 /NCGR_PEP_ID=MMETSP1326-20131121/12978_1 /TAXON_ID=1155430 /ORGANISM="Genus nov. species nov., Strain RCC2288" /LENGTH=296 /DNA_ID=CAMNT_0043156667 /DNA_START=93 /DNA_END=983 /DNA_ORIENTATION=+